MSLFEWITHLLDFFISFVPKFTIIRPTHAAVKWPWGGKPVGLKHGVAWFWPLVTEMEIMVIARQTKPLPPQSITLSDGSSRTLRAVTVYSISDIVAAIGQKNWDVEDTVSDLSQAAIIETVNGMDPEDLEDISEINTSLTQKASELLAKYGVEVEACKLVECAESTTHRILGDGAILPIEAE